MQLDPGGAGSADGEAQLQPRNQLIHSGDDGEEADYRYDHRGNLTEVLRGGVLTDSHTFDAVNLLTKAYSAERGEAE